MSPHFKNSSYNVIIVFHNPTHCSRFHFSYFSRCDKHYIVVRLAAFLRHILYTWLCEIHQTCKKSNGYYIRIYKEWYPFPTMDKYPFPIRSDIHPVYTFFRSKLSASFAQIIQVFTLKIEPIFLLPSITKKLPDVGSLS